MSGVATASAAGSAGLAALLGAASGGSLFGGSAATAPSSFGAALASAERMLDTSAGMTMPADAAASAPTTVAVHAAAAVEHMSTDEAGEESTAPDAGLSAPIGILAVPSITAPTESASHTVPVEAAIQEHTPAASGARPVTTADLTRMTDADAPATPVAASSTGSARASDPEPVAASPAPATPAAASPVVATSAAASQAVATSAPATPAPAGPAAATHPDAASDAPAAPTQPVTMQPQAAVAGSVTLPVVTVPETAAPAPRAVAAQVAPVVLHIVQRPVGSHQLTMTVTPDTLGPVTVRAHIGAGGEVLVEVLGATDAGRDALRTIVTDLRRDLAAVMPHASLTLGSNPTATDAGTPDRGAQSGSAGAPGEQAAGERGRGHTDARPAAERSAGGIPGILPITTRAVAGEGLDIFA